MSQNRKTDPYTPTPEAVTLASKALKELGELANEPPERVTFALVDPPLKEVQITIPGSMLRLIVNIFDAVSRGEPVTLLPHEAELSTQEAANFLNVSRPYLVKLLDEGHIPSRKVGVYRRVRAQDVMRYKQEERKRQEQVLDALAKEAQELELGY